MYEKISSRNSLKSNELITWLLRACLVNYIYTRNSQKTQNKTHGSWINWSFITWLLRTCLVYYYYTYTRQSRKQTHPVSWINWSHTPNQCTVRSKVTRGYRNITPLETPRRRDATNTLDPMDWPSSHLRDPQNKSMCLVN